MASEAVCFARISLGGPWKWKQCYYNGVKGVLAHRGEAPQDLISGKSCSDGLVYFSDELPSQEDLAKVNTGPKFGVVLSTGRTLDIPIAVYAPRFLAFDSESGGEHATEFGREAFRIWDKIDAKNYPTNAEMKRLVFLAVQQCYAVTEELLSQLGWVTDLDIIPVSLAISGRDPKSEAAVDAISRLSAAASL